MTSLHATWLSWFGVHRFRHAKRRGPRRRRRRVGFCEVLETRCLLTASPVFDATLGYPTGDEPFDGIVSADFNHDGHLDLVLTNYLGHAPLGPPSPITFLPGLGDGSFGAPVDSDTGIFPLGGPNLLVAGDFDHDGNLDLAAVDSTTTAFSVGVMWGNGNGTFQLASLIAGGKGVIGLAAGDFDHDGKIDLATAQADSFFDPTGTIRILPGTASRTFQTPTSIPLDFSPRMLGVGDVNGDGSDDFVVSTNLLTVNQIQVVVHQSGANYQALAVQETPITVDSMTVADVSGDHKADIVIGGYNATDASRGVMIGSGSSSGIITFTGPQLAVPTNGVMGLNAVDYDGDDDLDLFVGNIGDSLALTIYQNLGGAEFQFAQMVAPDVLPNSWAFDDFNEDGHIDVASVSSYFTYIGIVSVLLGSGSGLFSAGRLAAAHGDASVSNLADLNHDGIIDLLGAEDDHFSVRLGNGDGTFQAPLNVEADTASAVIAADMNGDDFQDVIVTSSTGSQGQIYYGLGNGQFSHVSLVNMDRPFLVNAIDVNDDDLPDLVFAPAAGAEGADIAVILNLGNEQFAPAVAYQVAAEPGVLSSPSRIVTGDFNGDHDVDLAIAYIGPPFVTGGVGLLFGNGDGTFLDGGHYLDGADEHGFVHREWNVAAGDLDGDGDLDLVSGDLTLLLNNGAGTFEVGTNADNGLLSSRFAVTSNLLQGPNGLAVADLDRDGIADILAGVGGDVVLFLKGQGQLTFAEPVAYTTGGTVNPFLADFNDDDKLDLLTEVTTVPFDTETHLSESRPLFIPNISVSVPTAHIHTTDILTAVPATGLITVTYTSGLGIDVSTIGDSDLVVTGPNGYNQTATLVSVQPSGNGSPRTATYQVTAPLGSGWTPADNGTYHVSLAEGAVLDVHGTAVPTGAAVDFTVNIAAQDVTAPTALLSASNVTHAGGNHYTFTVQYQDNVAVDVTTLATGNIAVTGPASFNQTAQFLSVDHNSNGSPLTATYQITVPNGTAWTTADNGTYAISLASNSVKDTAGNPVAAGQLGTFDVSITVVDLTAPTATLSAADVFHSAGSQYTFTVHFQDDIAIDIATLGTGDVMVTGPASFSQSAQFISVDTNSNGSPRTATFEITVPDGTSWKAADNGTYTVSVIAASVADTAGNTVASGSLGTFHVVVETPHVDPSTETVNVPLHRSTLIDSAADLEVNGASNSVVPGSQLRVTLSAGRQPGDTLLILTEGRKTGQINVAKGVLRLGRLQIGTVSGGTDTQPLRVTFNSNADLTIVERVLQRIAVRSAKKAPGTRQLTIDFLNPQGLGTEPAVISVNVA